MSDRTASRVKLINAALRVISSDYADPHANFDDESEYADEQLALAARDYVNAVNKLPANEQPVGWRVK